MKKVEWELKNDKVVQKLYERDLLDLDDNHKINISKKEIRFKTSNYHDFKIHGGEIKDYNICKLNGKNIKYVILVDFTISKKVEKIIEDKYYKEEFIIQTIDEISKFRLYTEDGVFITENKTLGGAKRNANEYNRKKESPFMTRIEKLKNVLGED
jgi:hypothetical protein